MLFYHSRRRILEMVTTTLNATQIKQTIAVPVMVMGEVNAPSCDAALAPMPKVMRVKG